MRKNRGFARSMKLNEAQVREQYNEFESARRELEESMIDKWSKKEGLDLGNKLVDLYEADHSKGANLALFLENTQKGLSRLNEYETSSFLGVTPQEIVKVARIAYPNAVMGDLFNVWGMESVRDTVFKLDTKYGTTKRGATADDIIAETWDTDGRYPSEIVEEEITGSGTDNYTGTMPTFPLRPFQFKVFLDDVQIGVDDGSGNFTGSGISTGTIDYTTGDYDVTLSASIDATHEVLIEGAYDSEEESNFDEQGTVTLGLTAYDFHAKFWSLGVAWHRMTEEIMQSKLNMSARDTLIQTAGQLMIKSMDELAMRYGKKAAAWHQSSNPITFDTDFATAGADSSYARAQDILDEAIQKALSLPYNALGRGSDTVNMVAGTSASAYLKKHKLYSPETVASRVGVYKSGNLDGIGLYTAPSDIVPVDTIYLFGKSNDALSVDSPVSVGTYRLGLETPEMEYKSFKAEKGLGAMADFRINNAKFAQKVTLLSL